MVLNLVNWNVNGIRAIIKKDFAKDVRAMAPDVLCMQETKGPNDEVASALGLFPEYNVFVNDSKGKKGYSGTAILSKEAPVRVTYDMAMEEYDQEGRVITAEFSNYFIVTVYTPNAGEGLSRLDYREKWDHEFNYYISWLMRRKPVIACGDFNVAHKEIDLARPKENYNRAAGYTQREIDGFQRLLDLGLTDTFRHLHPEEKKYSYWDYVTFARDRNVGWRIDYFLVSQQLLGGVKVASIFNEYYGSDHCPVGLRVEI
jgi:exodeoxyribonuclease-3